MENLFLTIGDCVDLLINGQVIGIGRVDTTVNETYYGG